VATDPYEYADALPDGLPRGRGAGLNPGNRHDTVRLHVLGEHLDAVAAERAAAGDRPRQQAATEVIADASRTIINRVDSPDIRFNWTINPYRGCEHGCSYCYARPDHERLGFSCGLDFETKIVAKHDAPAVLRRELTHPRWRGEPIVMSGVTDPYQPIERKLRITRGCLEVLAEARQAVGLITKNRLITRDLELITALHRHRAVSTAVSITTLDPKLAAAMEPRASSPADRLEAVRQLSAAGLPVQVMVAPVIPGLNDREVPAILEAAAAAGATAAGWVLLRLPHQLKALFLDWLRRCAPERAGRVESLLRQARGGGLYDATPDRRRRGTGAHAAQLDTMFKVYARRHGLLRERPPLNTAAFRPPTVEGQGSLF